MENFTCTFGSVSSNELMTHFSFVLERSRDYVCQFWSKETKEIVINFKQIVTNVLHSKWNRKITQFFIWWWKPKKKKLKREINGMPTVFPHSVDQENGSSDTNWIASAIQSNWWAIFLSSLAFFFIFFLRCCWVYILDTIELCSGLTARKK